MTREVGRNEPCPCGSGKKFKRCCLGRARTAAREMTRSTITAYTIAKIAEDPRSAGGDSRLRSLIERGLREHWTIAKVAAMTTEQIEGQLRVYGVEHSRERFLRLAKGHTCAWAVSQVWLESDPVTCRDKDQDFLGLAACELWKRYLPDRPSIEMIDDWMQEGYGLVDREPARACEVWWRVWCTLRPRFTRKMTTMDHAAGAFAGMQSVSNWAEDFETALGNASRKEAGFASLGVQYCTEWIAQFPDEEDLAQINFRRALASFLVRLGETDRALATLHAIVVTWPQNVWGYVALADAHSHFWGDEGYPLDREKAIAYLDRGLRLCGSAHDGEVLHERLEGLRSGSHS